MILKSLKNIFTNVFIVVALLLGVITPTAAKTFEQVKSLAEQGDASAQEELAEIYYDNQDIYFDREKAFYWNQKAANQGHAKAQYNLGYMYDYGKGVSQDYAKA